MASSETQRAVRILVTGGGTGGHTTPAVATIQAIRSSAAKGGWTPVFRYLGSAFGVERSLAAELGIEFDGIATGKLRRARTVLGLLSAANLRDAIRVPVGYWQALRAVRGFRPHVVLSTGGYVSVPGVLAASALRVPIVAHEQTVQVGLANRINFRVADVIALSVEETRAELPPALRQRAVVTGNPVRAQIFGGDPSRAARLYGFDPAEDSQLPTVYVTGGALGSRLINRSVEAGLANLLEFCRIIHQCGAQPVGQEQDFDRLGAARAGLSVERQRRYAVTKYVGAEIGDVYALASLVVGRSGAGTVTELCALGKPSLLIPLVPTGGDEQTRNARRLADAAAARILPQDSLTPQALAVTLEEMFSDNETLRGMALRAQSLAAPDAAEKLAAAVLAAAKQV